MQFSGFYVPLSRQKHKDMKKLAFLFVTLTVLLACSDEKAPFNYRGLPLSLTSTQFVDSMLARGFAVDSVASDSGKTVVFANKDVKYRVLMAFTGDKIAAVQENYSFSTNDSTRQLWQELRDGLEKDLDAWPNCPILKDDHKKADFETDGGFVSVILENTYKPTLMVLYQVKKEKKQ